MYRIIKQDGTELGLTESVLYIRIGSGGCFTPCKEQDAVGIAYQSTPYNLFGHTDIEGADTVLVRKCDGGAVVTHQRNLVDELILSALEV